MSTPRRPFPHESCPHCEYALAGLPPGSKVCPECGGALSAEAFATAAARRMARSSRARLALIVSPAVGIFAAVGVFASSRRGYFSLLVLFLCLWTGAALALYHSNSRRWRHNPLRAVYLGLPLGVGYFLALLAIAVVAVLIVAATVR